MAALDSFLLRELVLVLREPTLLNAWWNQARELGPKGSWDLGLGLAHGTL